VVLRGVSGIANVVPRKMNNLVSKVEGKYSKKETWTLDTTGSNLLDTLGLDYIDSTRTYSNDIREVFDVLGIEAARQTIHDEIVEVLEFSGAYANYHHLGVLCDRMTTNKDMVAIFRTGLFSDDIGPIAKATFEVHTEVLLDAARFGEADNMRGVSANVMCGQPGYYGTNAFQLTLDMDAIARMEAEDLAGLGRRRHGRPKADDHGVRQADAEDQHTTINNNNVNQSVTKSDIVIHNHVRAIAVDDTGMCEDDGYNAGF
jgi:DNA-directed RNA polymerase II subunit RPB1